MSITTTYPFTVGEFQITPLSREHGTSHHTALLSIRRNHSNPKHDRVYTFKPEFASRESALMYAAAQGRYWLLNPASMI